MSNNEWSNDPGMTALRYVLETMIHDRDSVEGILRHVHDEVNRLGDLMEMDWLEKQREWAEPEYDSDSDGSMMYDPTSDASFVRAATDNGAIPVYTESVHVDDAKEVF